MKIELSGSIILPHKDAVALLATIEEGIGIGGWYEENYELKDIDDNIKASPFSATKLEDLKKATLLGCSLTEYREQKKEKQHAKQRATGSRKED